MSRAHLPLPMQCRLLGLPVPREEYRFHPVRRWRFDFAFVAEKVAVEINGGAFIRGGGRHTRGAGFRNDTEKLAEAAILGWKVIPVLPEDVGTGKAIGWIQRALKG